MTSTVNPVRFHANCFQFVDGRLGKNAFGEWVKTAAFPWLHAYVSANFYALYFHLFFSENHNSFHMHLGIRRLVEIAVFVRGNSLAQSRAALGSLVSLDSVYKAAAHVSLTLFGLAISLGVDETRDWHPTFELSYVGRVIRRVDLLNGKMLYTSRKVA